MSSSDAKVIDFAQARVNQIADAITMLAEQIKLTNVHVERLNREMGEVLGEVGSLRREIADLRTDMNGQFDTMHRDVRELSSEIILQANHVISAQQEATRAIMRLDDREIPKPPEA